MSQYRITAPNGVAYLVTAPDSASQADVMAHFKSQYAMNQIAHTAPAHTSEPLGFYEGMMKPFDNTAQALEHGLKSIGVDTDAINKTFSMPSAEEATQEHGKFVQQQEEKGAVPGEIGKFAGEVAGTLPAALITKNPWVAGGLTGAALTDKKTPLGVAADTAIGAIGGKAGQAAIGGIGQAVAPKLAPAVRKLLGEGVKMTPGQILGGVAKRTEDALSSIPGLSTLIRRSQAESIKTFNRAAINRALAPIGEKLPDHLVAGHEAIAHAGDMLSEAYENLLPKLTTTADAPFGKALTDTGPNSIGEIVRKLPESEQTRFRSILGEDVLKRFTPEINTSTGQMSLKMDGETMKKAESSLTQFVNSRKSAPDPDTRDLARAVGKVRDELRGMVARSNPIAAPKLAKINEGWANLARVEKAAGRAGTSTSGQQEGGIFSTQQLQQAVREADTSARKRLTARGGSLMQDLAEAGGSRLPQSVPDSGTPERAFLDALVLGGGGTLAAAAHNPGSLAALGATAGLYTKPGQALARTALTQRPAWAAPLAQQIVRYLSRPAAVAGGAGAQDVASQLNLSGLPQ